MVIVVIMQKWCGSVETKISTGVVVTGDYLDGWEWFYGYCGYHWLSVVLQWFLWLQVGLGLGLGLWLSVVLHGYLWLSLVLHG